MGRSKLYYRSEAHITKYADLIGDARNDTETNKTGVQLSLIRKDNGNDVHHRVIGFDSAQAVNGNTPYIINTVNGNIFPHHSTGLVVENGLIKNFGLNGITTSGDQTYGIIGFKISDGLVVSCSTAPKVWTGSFTISNVRIHVYGGVITDVETI